MPSNIFAPILEFFLFLALQLTGVLPAAQNSITVFLFYALEIFQSVLIIVLFWVGPFISLRLVAILVGFVVVLETIRIGLVIFRFIKKYIPVA